MNELKHAQRIKATLLTLLICVSCLMIVGEVIAYRRQKTQPALTPQPTIPEMLVQLNSSLNPEKCGYLNAERAARVRALLDDPTRPRDLQTQVNVEMKYAEELLNTGKTNEALREYHIVAQQVKTNAPDAWPDIGSYLRTREAIGYLRLGEQQNCCSSAITRVPASYRSPERGSTRNRHGSRGAIKCLAEALKPSVPTNTAAQWLLNLAYMTIGELSAGRSPRKWLIPLKELRQ